MPTATDARISESILAASKEALSSSLALLSELSLFNLLFQKSADWLTSGWNLVAEQKWTSDCNHFAEQLKTKTEQYSHLSHGECLLRVLGELEKLMDVKPRDLRTRYDVAEVAEDLCMATIKMLRADKSAKFGGSTPADLMDYQMGRTFAGLKIAVAKLSGDQQGQVFENVRKFIADMPADQQEFILKQLGASELTDAVIRSAMLNGTLWTAFAVAVQVFGFAFYMAAAQLLAIISFGLLPFGAYIGLSSLISVLSGPWMLPVFLTFGGWLYSRQNIGLRKSTVPMLLVTLWISGMEMENRPKGDVDKSVEEALQLWGAARDCRDRNRLTAQEAKRSREEAKAALDATMSELQSARSTNKWSESRIEVLSGDLSREILNSVRDIAQGSWGQSDQASALQVVKVEDRIAQARVARDAVQGWWDRALEEVKYWTGDYLTFSSELENAQKYLVSQITRRMEDTAPYPQQVVFIFRQIEVERARLREVRRLIADLESTKSRQESELSVARQAFSKAETAQIESEKRYYGLEKV